MADLLATLIPALGRALLHFVWQGAAIGLLAAIALQLLRDARPQARYAVACAALLACVLVPTLGLLAQLVEITPASGPTTAAAAATATYVSGTIAAAAIDIAAWPARVEGFLPLIVALWAAGASVLSLRMAMGVAWIRRLQATPQGPAQRVWQMRLDALAERFGLTRPVALRLVDPLDSPASAGWLRPVVLLPAALIARMPVDLIEALLAHELAHIRRHDYLVNLLQSLVEALLFYHPVTWWLSRRIRNEREQIADQLAAEATGAPRRLALALSELSELIRISPAPLHLAQAAHGGHLMSRIQQLVQPGRRTAGGGLVFPLIGVVAACVALYAQAQVAKPDALPTPVVAPAAAASPIPARAAAVVAPARAAMPAPAPAAMPVPAVTRGPVLPPHPAVAQVTRIDPDDSRDAYALVRKDKDGFSMSGSMDDIEAIKAARARLDRDFIWFRRNGRAQIVVDPATVARAVAAWREVERLSPQMEALGEQMEDHGARMEEFGAKMEALSARHQASPAMEAAAHEMERLAAQQQRIAGQQMQIASRMAQADDAQREALEQQMDALSAQIDAFGQQMDQQGDVMDAEARKLEANLEPIEALGRQMEAAAEPMEALGERMEALGEQQERHAEAAEREMRGLIDAAVQQGLAQPAPGGGETQ